MPATDRAPQYAKDERQRLLDEWRQQGLGIDEIARRFRCRYKVGALIAYRWANDLTQLEVANRYSRQFLGADAHLAPQRISEYERWPRELGGREPPLTVLQGLAVIYHTTVDRLAVAVLHDRALGQHALPRVADRGGLDALDRQPGRAGVGAEHRQEVSGTLGQTLDQWDELMRRRTLLAYAGATAAAVLVPGLPVAPPRLPAGTDPSQAYGELAALTATYRQLDGLLGPTAVYPQVISHHRRLAAWEYQVRGQPQWPQVARLATDASILLAWLHFDLERYPDAAELYRQATEIAGALGDVSLQAFLVGRMSRTLSECGQHQEALAFAAQAAGLADTKAAPLVRSWLAVTRAYVAACLGDERACRTDLQTAHALLDRADSQPPGPYIGFYGHPYLDKWTGHALLRLAERKGAALAEGRAVLDQALDRWSTVDVRESGEVLAACASARLAQREVDEAAGLAVRAYDIATATSSLRVLRHVAEFRRQLDPYRDTPAVQALDQRMLASQ